MIKICEYCDKEYKTIKSKKRKFCSRQCSLAVSRKVFHGKSSERIYLIWHGMKNRCYDKNVKVYHRYGGRGIKVCQKWLDFENFYNDMGDRPEGMTLDRIDNNKGYSKENCRWATYKEQNRNRRDNRIIEYRGEKKTLAEWSEVLKIKSHTLRARIFRHAWPIEKAFETSVRKKAKNREAV